MRLFSSHEVIIAATRVSTLILSIFAFSLSVTAQENNELAIANEVIINSSPLHDEVAEKYLKIATGEQHTAIADVTNSATKLFIPLDRSLPDGTVIHNDKPQSACRNLRTYIRQLRVGNSAIRKKEGRPKPVYNFLCSPNSILTASALPNDSRIGELWAINQSNNVDLDLLEAWNKWTGGGSTEVVVAVIDTGIDYNHPDLAANMWKNTAELNGMAGVDDDHNGVIDDIYGFNAVTGAAKPGDPNDDHYHGTHVAGTIGGVGNNGQGVAGVAWNIKLMGAKFLKANGSGSTFDAVKAVDYITNQKLAGVNVVASNNSWGGGGYDPSLFDAITRANNAGILFIAAAGNSGISIDQNPSYPASYNVPNVISVGAIDAAGNLASFSNYGTGNVDIVAPGVSILSCSPNAGYQYLSGTSMATPQVSGAIALLKSYAPTMTMNQLRDTLYNTGKSVAGAIGKTKYGTMPSVYEMLREADRLGLGLLPPTPAPTSTPRPTATPTRTPTPTITPTPTATIAPGYFAVKGVAIAGSKKLSHAKVTLQIGNQTLVTYTDANGAFSFMNVYGPVNYTLNVNSAGYTFSSYGSNLIGNVDLTLAGTVKNYVLKAKIINENNQPVSGVSISDSTFGTVISGADGMVQFNVPYGSSYALYAQQADSDFLASKLSGQIFGDVTRIFVRLPD